MLVLVMSILTGHRGAKKEFPENTILSIRHAISSGCKAIEIDIHQTKDNQLVVIHDATIDRTSNGKGRVDSYTYEELLEFDFGKGQKIPALSEVLELAKETKIKLMIESKILGIEDEIVRLIDEFGLYKNTYVISFHHSVLLNIKNMNKNIQVGSSCFCNPVDPIGLMNQTQSRLLMISIETIDKRVVDLCHKNGREVAVFNANNEDGIRRMIDLKADYILTDYPSQLSSFFRECL